MTSGTLRATRTTCPYCGVGCGVVAATAPDGTTTIKGDPDHPANFGRLCSKGSALAETLGLEDRLLHPEIGGKRVSWDAALDAVAGTFQRTIAEHGPDSVAFYVSGQFLTEDYYVANKLMKGFIGSANIDTNSRLCMASSVAGHRRAFGADTVPVDYTDLEAADLVVLVGSNLAWCHPVIYQRLAAAKAARPGLKVVLVDPRETATAQLADLHLPLAPGSDVALFNGLLDHLALGYADGDFVAQHTSGLDADAGGRADGGLRRRLARNPPGRAGPAALLRSVRADRKGGHGLFAGRQPIGRRHGQGQCDHQLPSPDRADRPAGHGAVLHDRTAERDGRARGRRPCQSARGAYGHRQSAASPDRAGLLAKSGAGGDAGAEGRRPVRGRRRRSRQGAVDHGDQSGRQHAGRRRGGGSAAGLPLRRRLRGIARHGHRAIRGRPAAGGRLGREGRHGHQLRAPDLPPARVPAGTGRDPARLADHRAGRGAHGLREGFRLHVGSADIPRACRPVRVP